MHSVHNIFCSELSQRNLVRAKVTPFDGTKLVKLYCRDATNYITENYAFKLYNILILVGLRPPAALGVQPSRGARELQKFILNAFTLNISLTSFNNT